MTPHGGDAAAAAGVDLDDEIIAQMARLLDRPGIAQVLEVFLDTLPRMLDELEDTVSRGDAAAARTAAHALKGSAATLGARRVAAHAAELEAHARAGSLAQAGALMQQIVYAGAAAEGAVRDLLLKYR